jgi:hypothetical protein
VAEHTLEPETTMQHTFSTPEPVSLYVELGPGDVTIHTDDVSETVVDVHGKDADDVVVEQRGDQIVVLGPRRRVGFFGNGDQVGIHVSMPYDSMLATKLGSADLSVRGRLGDTALKTGSGDIEIEDVSGDLLVESGSGDLVVAEVRGETRVKSGSGSIRVRHLAGSASVTTGSGDVVVDRAGADVAVKSGSGDLHVREAVDGVALSTASGDLVVDTLHRGELRANNVSGDIRVGIPAGIPVWTDISTVTGSVRSDLQGAGEPAEGQDFVALRAKTVSGDILLRQL